jgi:hypothetical protein
MNEIEKEENKIITRTGDEKREEFIKYKKQKLKRSGEKSQGEGGYEREEEMKVNLKRR